MNRIVLFLFITFHFVTNAQSWEELGPAPIARHHPISFAIDGKGYTVTGTSSFGQPTDEVYEYDPTTDNWTALTDFPGAARSFGIGAVADGIAYLGFGASNFQYFNDLWSFDPIANSWTQLASCPCSGRRHPAMIAIGNKLYVGLGDDPTGDLKDWHRYDMSTNTWVQIADLPGPNRHHPFMFNAGGEVFAGMGHGGPVIYKDWYKLDTANNVWTAMNDFPGEARVAGTQFSIDGYGYVLSGDGDNHNFMATGEMWRYEPSSDSWVEFPPHPGTSRWAPGSFVIDKDIYFFGGLNRSTSLYPTDVWKFADTTSNNNMDTVGTSIRENQDLLTNTYIYPNPARNIVLWNTDESISHVQLFNTYGQLIKSYPAERKHMRTDELSDGLYLIHFYSDSKLAKTSKVLIRRD